jgi:hypothetical protein
LADKRVTKDDHVFNKILHSVEKQVQEFDSAALFSLYPKVFHAMPEWVVNIPRMREALTTMDSFLMVSKKHFSYKSFIYSGFIPFFRGI